MQLTTGIITLISVATAFVVASVIKAVIELIKGNRNVRKLFSSGGMPSVHTASVAALAIAIGLGEGFDSTLFALSLVFSIIVAYDATHVRRATGEQGNVLNKILPKDTKQPYSSDGHKPIEMIVGGVLGIIVGLIVHYVIFLA